MVNQRDIEIHSILNMNSHVRAGDILTITATILIILVANNMSIVQTLNIRQMYFALCFRLLVKSKIRNHVNLWYPQRN